VPCSPQLVNNANIYIIHSWGFTFESVIIYFLIIIIIIIIIII
jgi:hypothetical protein